MKRSEYKEPEVVVVVLGFDDLLTESQPFATEPDWQLNILNL